MRSKLATPRRRARRGKLHDSKWAIGGHFHVESLECRRLLAAHDPTAAEPFPDDSAFGTVHGQKWEDLDGNGQRDPGEAGLAGVTIYADLNWNGIRDRSEPSTVTQRDVPETDFDETGLYTLWDVPAGEQLIREVVPVGYLQTFPGTISVPVDPPIDEADDIFARVEPPVLALPIHPGETWMESVAIAIEPLCFRPYEIDVVVSDPAVKFENLSGVQPNGCGGDVSRFEVAISVERTPIEFEIQFVDAEFGGVLASMPVFSLPEPHAEGGHVVQIDPGGGVDNIDFGNARQPGGAIEGRKWLDGDGDGQWDPDEVGWGGVTIYADLNDNGVLDRGEPTDVTAYDIPETDFDEAGLYQLSGLAPGEYVVREIVPRDFVQTFPRLGGTVLDSQTGRMNAGVAIDLRVTDVAIFSGPDGSQLDAELELTVEWPDTCGTLIETETAYAVVGDHIVVELFGHQVGDACAEVISAQQTRIKLSDLDEGRYQVVATLHELLPGGERDIATLAALAPVAVGEPGAHRILVAHNELVSDINFGNRWQVEPGSITGHKWLDNNGNGVRDADEPGLAGVTIYADLNGNHVWDRSEPATETWSDDPSTPEDETGHYVLDQLLSGEYSIREVVPPGSTQTFPAGGSQIHSVDIEDAPPGRALTFDIIDVQADAAADGVWGAVLTLQVVWPNGCNSLLDDATTFDFDGNRIHIQLLGAQVSDVCSRALVEQTVSIHVPNISAGNYDVHATLVETDPDGTMADSFVLHASLSLGGDGEHRVVVMSGDAVSGIDFGNQDVEVPPPDGVPPAADMDHDGHLDADDIDLLAAAIRSADPAATRHDLTGDRLLDQSDLEYMVEDVMKTRFGDANLDGVFDSSDLVKVFAAGQYEDPLLGNSGWQQGDWDGDGDFTSSDLVFALQRGDYRFT